VVAFRTASKVRELEKAISENQDWIHQNDQSVNRRIDQEIDRVDQIYRECLRHTDSRVDKLEQKLTSIDSNGCEPVKKKKLING
jgi:DNA mismatch repair ATPase MutS